MSAGQYDVTPAQMHVLLYLGRNGGQAPQCELTGFLRVKPPTANGILDRLEEKGMVVRSVSGTDARPPSNYPDGEGKPAAGAVPAAFSGSGTANGSGIHGGGAGNPADAASLG